MTSFMKRVGLVLGATLLLSGVAGCAKDTANPQQADPTAQNTTSQSTQQPSSPTSSDEPTQSAEPTSSPSSQTPTPTAKPTTAKPTEKPLMALGSKGDQVRELQHRLLQLAWCDGKITDTYGEATKEAVTGFQHKRKLTATGAVDKKTWDVLVSMTKKPTHDQMYNILKPGPAIMKSGSQGDKVRDAQARLKQLDWFSPKIDGIYGPSTVAGVKGFQQKRQIPVTGEIDQRTLGLLVGMTRTPTAEELQNKPPKVQQPGSLDPRCMTGRVLCISKNTNRMYWMIDGKVIDSYSVRFGSEQTPTREGQFSVYWKSREHVSTIYHTAMPFAMFFDGGQAVHYSADFAARGYNGASHGCVNVRDRSGIQWLFDTQVKVGDKVVVFR